MKEFISVLKAAGGHILSVVKTSDGRKTMIYYREQGSYPTDVKTRTF